MDEIDFLTIDELLVIHRDQTQRYGGDAEVRDFGLLESALAQPQAAFAGNTLHAFPFEWQLRTYFISFKIIRLWMGINVPEH